MFQTGRIAARPPGVRVNDKNIMRQVMQSRGMQFNPFAAAAPATMYAAPSNYQMMPFGGYNNSNIGPLLQQFSQPYGPSPFGAIPQASPQQAQSATAFMNQYRSPQPAPMPAPAAAPQPRPSAIPQASAQQAQSATAFINQYRNPQQAASAVAPQGIPSSASTSRQAQLMAQEAAMRGSISSAPAGGGMTLGGGPRNFGMTPSPQGMNAQNNMAFLQQAQAARRSPF